LQPNSDKGSRLVYLLGIMGSLTVITVSIFQNKNLFPEAWIKLAIIFILVLYLFIIIYLFFFESICLKYKDRMIKRKKNETAQKHFPELARLKGKFEKLISFNNGITGVFNNLKSQSEIYKYLDVPQLNGIKNLLADLDNLLKNFDDTGENFELLIGQFESILKIYNEFYVNAILKDIKCLRQIFKNEIIPENIKKQYYDQKAEYDNFVYAYREFGERVNREYGNRIVHDYIEKIEDLN
jgi:hypothetical protein